MGFFFIGFHAQPSPNQLKGEKTSAPQLSSLNKTMVGASLPKQGVPGVSDSCAR